MEPKEKKAFEPSGLVPRSIVRTFERFRQQLLPGSETAAIREYRISRYQVLVSARCLFTLLIIPIATNWLVSSWLLSPLVEHFWNTQQNEIFLNSYQEERAFAELESFSEKLFFESLLNTTNTINVDIQRNNEVLNPLQVANPEGVFTHIPFPYPVQAVRDWGVNTQAPVGVREAPGLRLEDLSKDLSEDLSGVVLTNCVNEGVNSLTQFLQIFDLYNTIRYHNNFVISDKSSICKECFRNSSERISSSNKGVFASVTTSPIPFESPRILIRHENGNANTTMTNLVINSESNAVDTLLGKAFDPALLPPMARENPDPSALTLPYPIGVETQYLPLQGLLQLSYCTKQSPLQVAIPLQVAELTPYPEGVNTQAKSLICKGLRLENLSKDLPEIRIGSYKDESPMLRYRHIPFWSPLQRILMQRERNNTSTTTICSNWESKATDFSASVLSAHTLGYSLPLDGVGDWANTGVANPLQVQIEDLSGVCPHISFPDKSSYPSGVTKSSICTCKGLRASSVLSVPLESTYDNSLKIKEKVQNKILELAIYYNQQTIISITNIIGDVVSLITLGCLFILMKPEITILKSFLIEAIYSLSDTTKSFLLILLTDLLVGFHSPRGWETALELLLKHFGLPENQDFVFLFVATFPVLLDTVFKYWIFRHLNKISPSTVATYHSMIE